ncbi:MAG TPA: hypothetical protein V6D17_21925 [Candidatus Obscuribacterales bacterium]
MTRTNDADEIVHDINAGNVEDAIAHLREDYLNLSAQDFRKLLEEIDRQTKADDRFYGTNGNNLTGC